MYTRFPLLAIALAAAFCVNGSFSSADLVDFNSLPHGFNLSANGHMGLSIFARNNNPDHPDLSIIFDSTQTGTPDPDLEGPPWAFGNLPLNTHMGSLAIIAANDVDADGDGLIDVPEDEGAGGDITVIFSSPITRLGFDLVDIDSNWERNGFVQLSNAGQFVARINFFEFEAIDGAVFGDNSINRISPISVPGASFDRVIFRLKASGGIDNLLIIPEPNGLLLLALGLASYVCARRRR